MMLKYIGKDGVDGLRNGNVYDCLICSHFIYHGFDDDGIYVSTKFPDLCFRQHYKTIKEMLENWQEV